MSPASGERAKETPFTFLENQSHNLLLSLIPLRRTISSLQYQRFKTLFTNFPKIYIYLHNIHLSYVYFRIYSGFLSKCILQPLSFSITSCPFSIYLSIYLPSYHLLVYYQVLPLYFVIFPKEQTNLLDECRYKF